MSSCGLYNKYERPDIMTTGLIRDSASITDTLVARDTTSFANIPWRSVFTDPYLQGLIEKGLANNADLLNAALNVKTVEAALKAAKLAFIPQVTFSPSGSISSFDGGEATKAYSLPFNASWTVDLFGGLLNAKRGAQMTLLATQDYQVVVQTKLIAGIANLYYTLLMLDKEVEIMDEMIALSQETYDIMSLQFKLGTTKSTSVLSAQSSLMSMKARKIDLLRQIRESENALSLLVGQPAQTIARGKMDDQSLPETFSTGVGIQLLKNRADVHYYEMTLANCFYDVQAARAAFYPNITISGTGSFTNSSGTVNPGKWLLSAVGSLVQPIFMNGKLTYQLRAAENEYQKALNNWQNSVLTAGSEVSDALVQYNSYAEKSALEAEQLQVLKKIVDDTRLLYKQSGSTYLEVITAQTNLVNTQLSKVADDLYKMQAVVSLYQALGGGAK